MKNLTLTTILAATTLSFSAHALDMPGLTVTVEGIEKDGAWIPSEQAFCKADAGKHTADGGNINPAISWTPGPNNPNWEMVTKSYAIVMHDPDVPSVFDDANKEGKTISKDLKRMDFYHWVLVDIPANRTSIAKGVASKGITYLPTPYVSMPDGTTQHHAPKIQGKPTGKKPYGLEGKNDYSTFMGNVYGGYDGPCPPWNDEIVHRYHITVYALNVETLGLPESGEFTGAEALKAMEGHIINRGTIHGVYSQNPGLLPR